MVAKTLTTQAMDPALLGAVMDKLTDELEPAEGRRDYALGSIGRAVSRGEPAGYHLQTLRGWRFAGRRVDDREVFDDCARRPSLRYPG